MVTSGTMTNRVDRLAARGLVSREVHPDDRRGVLVTLTGTGRSRWMPRWPTCWRPRSGILDSLSPAECEQLAGSLRRLLLRYADPVPEAPDPRGT